MQNLGDNSTDYFFDTNERNCSISWAEKYSRRIAKFDVSIAIHSFERRNFRWQLQQE